MKTKFFSLITAFVMILSFSVFVPEINAKATQNRTANFSKDYTLGSDPAQNILNIALAQQGKTGSDLGYSEEWCADFVSDCADLAGQSDAIPRYGAVSGLKTRILNAGGYDVTSSPRAGDIVFFSGHVEIVNSVSGGQIYSIGGNTTSASSLYSRKVCSPRVHGRVVSVIRPNYDFKNCLNNPNITLNNTENIYIGDDVNLSWESSDDNPIFDHYWITIWENGTVIIDEQINKGVTTYSFKPTVSGTYKVTVCATPVNEPNGDNSLRDTIEFAVQSKLNIPNITLNNTENIYIGNDVNLSWESSDDNPIFDHYWITIFENGIVIIDEWINKGVTTYSFKPAVSGTYKVIVCATPVNEPNGDNSLRDTIEFNVIKNNLSEILKGDTNDDGQIDIADVVAVASYVGDSKKNPLSNDKIIAGDVHNTGDGLTANDALMIQQYISGIITKF